MATQVESKWIKSSAVTESKIANGAVTADKIGSSAVTALKLDSTAKQAVLESKLQAQRAFVLNFSATGSDDTVTTEVQAAATTDTPRTALNAKGIYTGSVTNAADVKRVLIRAAGTNDPISDGENNEVYGVLTETGGVFTLSYKQSDGGTYTFAAPTNIDFGFVVINDMYDASVEADLQSGVGAVVDATTASAINNHINDSTDAHADTAITYSRADGSKINIAAGSDTVAAAINDLDDAIGLLDSTPTNYTAVDVTAVASHLAGIDSALAGISGSTEFADNVFRITGSADNSKKVAFEVDGLTASTTRTVTMPDRSLDLGNVTQTTSEVLTLNGTDITNKYKDLTVSASVKSASNVRLFAGGLKQEYTTDYTVITDGTYVRRVNWSGLGLDGVLESGDKIFVYYEING
jgi:hypothetical protein